MGREKKGGSVCKPGAPSSLASSRGPLEHQCTDRKGHHRAGSTGREPVILATSLASAACKFPGHKLFLEPPQMSALVTLLPLLPQVSLPPRVLCGLRRPLSGSLGGLDVGLNVHLAAERFVLGFWKLLRVKDPGLLHHEGESQERGRESAISASISLKISPSLLFALSPFLPPSPPPVSSGLLPTSPSVGHLSH